MVWVPLLVSWEACVQDLLATKFSMCTCCIKVKNRRERIARNLLKIKSQFDAIKLNLVSRRKRARPDLPFQPDPSGEATASEPTTPSVETAAHLAELDTSQVKAEHPANTTKGATGSDPLKEVDKSSYPAVMNPPKLHISSLKLESPKLQKNIKKLSAQSSVISSKIGDSLSGYMEKISQKMKATENLSALSTDFGDRKRSPPMKRASKQSRKSAEENSLNIYEVIEVPKMAQGISSDAVCFSYRCYL